MNDSERREKLRLLMLHHDAELNDASVQAVEERLRWDVEAQSYLNELQILRRGVRDVHAERALRANLTDDIMASIEREQKTRHAADPHSSWPRWQLAFCSAAALAAAAMLWLHAGSHSQVAIGAAEAPLVEASPGASNGSGGVAIESVDFGVRGGSIFMVQAGEDTTPVVWLSEPEVEVRSEPL